MVAEVAQEMIESLGYTVKRASNGDEALKMFNEAEQTGQPFDLVFLDLTVPGGMGGAETVKYIKEMRADVPCIVASGYADTRCSPVHRFRLDGVLPNLSPFPSSAARARDGRRHAARRATVQSADRGRHGMISATASARYSSPRGDSCLRLHARSAQTSSVCQSVRPHRGEGAHRTAIDRRPSLRAAPGCRRGAGRRRRR